jgi:hypothetical protein
VETSEALPGGAVHDDDIAAIARRKPPFVSVYLHTEGAIENAAQRSMVRWKKLRSQLEERQAPTAVLDEIGELVSEAHMAGDCLAVIADAQEIRLVDHGTPRDPNDFGDVGYVPRLIPVIRWRQEQPTAVVVLADRRGADLFALRRSEPEQETTVEGKDYPLTKVAAGGWSQRRYQERAENTWGENAEEVALAVERLVARTEPRIVVVVGDGRAGHLIGESLSEQTRTIVRMVPRELRGGGSPDVVADGVREVVESAVREDGDALIARLREEIGQGDLGVEGFSETATALAEAQAAVLLIAGGDDRVLWVGPDPLEVADGRQPLVELSVEEPKEVPAADGAVRAALAGGAGVRVYDVRDPTAPSGTKEMPRDGIGALLRWSEGQRAEVPTRPGQG